MPTNAAPPTGPRGGLPAPPGAVATAPGPTGPQCLAAAWVGFPSRPRRSPPFCHDLPGDLPLGKLGLSGHHPPLKGRLLQEGQDGGEFLALAIRSMLPSHPPRAMGVGCHQVDAWQGFALDAPQRFAIHGQGFARPQPLLLEPRPQPSFKGRAVSPAENQVQGRHARCGSPGKAQLLGHGAPLVPPPLGDGVEATAPTHHGAHRQREHRAQRMTPTMGTSRIRYASTRGRAPPPAAL